MEKNKVQRFSLICIIGNGGEAEGVTTRSFIRIQHYNHFLLKKRANYGFLSAAILGHPSS
jgi:hypothetical protein